MKVVFLDTNVILDYLLDRDGCEVSMEILKLGYDKKASLCASALTLSNIAYITRKVFKGNDLYNVLNRLCELLEISKVDKDIVEKALALQADDFEDALQYFSAMEIGAKCIVTSNVKDFSYSAIPVYTPTEFCDFFEI